MNTIVESLYGEGTLVIIKVKHESKIRHVGVYCPVKPVKKEEDNYFWEEDISASKNCFLFTFCENDHAYLTCDAGTKILSVYSCS